MVHAVRSCRGQNRNSEGANEVEEEDDEVEVEVDDDFRGNGVCKARCWARGCTLPGDEETEVSRAATGIE